MSLTHALPYLCSSAGTCTLPYILLSSESQQPSSAGDVLCRCWDFCRVCRGCCLSCRRWLTFCQHLLCSGSCSCCKRAHGTPHAYPICCHASHKLGHAMSTFRSQCHAMQLPCMLQALTCHWTLSDNIENPKHSVESALWQSPSNN